MEILIENNYYRKILSEIYKHSNYQLIYSLLAALTGSFIYNNDPLYGFTIFAWSFLILYFFLLNIYVLY
jgi:hypothetical protein